MSKALYIQAEFRHRSIQNYGVMAFPATDAFTLIRRACHEGGKVLGEVETGACDQMPVDRFGAKPHEALRSEAATIQAEAASKKVRQVSDH
jgi:hypothetical protein